MQYRKMEKTDGKLSVLGFGCMRLPVLPDGHVDVPETTTMIRYAVDHGMNYVDTAYPYHMGESEAAVGMALQDGYRERVQLATKLPPWLVKSREDMDRILAEQLKKLQTDHIDYYLIHALDRNSWPAMKALGVTKFLDAAKADGRIGHAGFSFHDDEALFEQIVDSYAWDFCQIQYSFMDEAYQAGTQGLKYASSKGLGVVVMEPLRGGSLTKTIPEIERIWSESEKKRSPAAWALHWVWDHPEVTVVLSGMSAMGQVEENVAVADSAEAGAMTPQDLELVGRVRETYRRRMKVSCTACKYCMPCPNGVNIPGCFEQYNNASMYEAMENARFFYNYSVFLGANGRASRCVECGECMEKCPQQIPIPDVLKDVEALLG
jgi:uncharacterized protein